MHYVPLASRPRSIFVGPVLCALLLAFGPSHAAEPMALGVPTQPSAALLQVAVEQGLLAAEGIEARVTRYPSGKRALVDGLLAGDMDVVSVAEAPVVFNAFSRDDFVVVASIFQADNVNRVIARRDAGISAPADLRGKRVATQRLSAVHYFLHLFMLKNGLSRDNGVELSFMPAEALPEALAAGEIDAFSMREPFIGQALDRLGDKAIVFEEPGLYPQFELLVVRRDYLEAEPKAVRGLLRALLAANASLQDDPARGRTAIARFLGVEPTAVNPKALGSRPTVRLDQSMLTEMESEAEWLIDDGLVPQRTIPNFLDIIDPAPLATVSPNAVSVRY